MDVNVVFLGDSLIEDWEPAIWKTRIEPLGAVNLGVSGEGTAQLRWRIERGDLDSYAPKVIVLMIGINNFWPGYSAEDTALGIEAIVAALREKQPQAKVLLLGLVPVFDRYHKARDWIKAVNARIARIRGVHFLDLSDRFLEADGSLRAGFYHVDQVHWQPAAYRMLADHIEPLIREWLGGEAALNR